MFRIGILLFFVVQLGFAGDLPLKFGPRHNVEIVAKKDGISQVKITGPSAHFWSQPVTSGPKRTVLAFEYFSTTGINSLSVRFRDADESMAFVGSAPVPLSETWQPFSIELSEVPTTETRFHFSLQSKLNAGLLIRNLTIREPTTEEIAKRENLAKITAARQTVRWRCVFEISSHRIRCRNHFYRCQCRENTNHGEIFPTNSTRRNSTTTSISPEIAKGTDPD